MLKFMEINQIVFTKTKEVYYKNEDTTLEETKLGGEKMTKSEMIEKLVKEKYYNARITRRKRI